MMYGIQLSGGNNTLKHILSPQQFLLSKIISVFYGYNVDLVTNSFLTISKNKELSRSIHDFTSEKDRFLLKTIRDKKEQDEKIFNADKELESKNNSENVPNSIENLTLINKKDPQDAANKPNNIENAKPIKFNYNQKRNFHNML